MSTPIDFVISELSYVILRTSAVLTLRIRFAFVWVTLSHYLKGLARLFNGLCVPNNLYIHTAVCHSEQYTRQREDLFLTSPFTAVTWLNQRHKVFRLPREIKHQQTDKWNDCQKQHYPPASMWMSLSFFFHKNKLLSQVIIKPTSIRYYFLGFLNLIPGNQLFTGWSRPRPFM